MTKKSQDSDTGAKATTIVPIVVAVISLIGNLVLGYWQFILKPGEANQLTATPEPSSLAIENIPLDIFAYGGNGESEGGFGTFVLIHDRENIPNYKLDYSLPNDRHGYAGLAFNFHDSMNISGYNSIEYMILFSQSRDEIDLYIKDVSDHFNTIRIVNNGANEMTFRHEFKNFPSINFNAVKEIGLVVSTEFSTGTHQVVVKDIRFTR